MGFQLTGLQHIGIPVSNMEQSLAFYRDVLGCEVLFIAGGSGADLSKALGVPDTHLSFAFLKAGNSLIELLEYFHPKGKPYDRMNCDLGACHVALHVPDIDVAYKELEAKGVRFNAPPMQITEGPLVGCAFAYFPDPDGAQLEIFQTAK